ncbi:MAG TPA: DUF5666 domain-containing protein [Candidatus Acidoferrales bacterium]|jgi:hypothetical protein|nr:DUF5666 domain-containing protein [Candidatus Acidoferrales bacterium]
MKRVLFVTLFSIVFALALTVAGCGGGNNSQLQATGASTTVQFGDATNDQIAKFEITVSSITLTGANGTANTANLLASPVEFEFSHAAGALEPVSLSKVPAGTYSAATITWSDPEIVTVNAGTPTKLTVSPSSGTANVTSSVTISDTANFLNFDMDLASSVTINGTSATINPTFSMTATNVPANANNEDDDDGDTEVHGSVTGITAPQFTIQTQAGASITFTTDANTRFKDGLTQLSDLKTGDIVEVRSTTQTDGTKLATRVEREENEGGEEMEGLIQNLDNPLTTITIVHQLDSNKNASAPTTVDISVDNTTQYEIHADKLTVTGTFDATHIGKGQRIEADADGQTAPVVAKKVRLREQALVGTVSNATSTGFTLAPSSTSAFGSLSGATSVAVTIDPNANVKTTPVNGGTVRVRGIVLFDGTNYTMTATRVDNNQ